MSPNFHGDEIGNTLRFPSSRGGVDAPSNVRKARPGWSETFSDRPVCSGFGTGPFSYLSQPPRLWRRGIWAFQWILLAVFALTPTVAFAQQDKEQDQHQTQAAPANTEATQKQTDDTQPKTEEDSKLKSVPGGKALGMSILGNQEAPKALVIVPWKSSELGNGPSVSTLLDDSRLPVDKEVFMRMLTYYEISSESARPSGAPTSANATVPATPAPRRKP
jgi:hypothetical protein